VKFFAEKGKKKTMMNQAIHKGRRGRFPWSFPSIRAVIHPVQLKVFCDSPSSCCCSNLLLLSVIAAAVTVTQQQLNIYYGACPVGNRANSTFIYIWEWACPGWLCKVAPYLCRVIKGLPIPLTLSSHVWQFNVCGYPTTLGSFNIDYIIFRNIENFKLKKN
jgi:hypothetical protein